MSNDQLTAIMTASDVDEATAERILRALEAVKPRIDEEREKVPCQKGECVTCKSTSECWLWHDMTIHNMPPYFGNDNPEPEFEYHMGYIWKWVKRALRGEELSPLRGTEVRDLLRIAYAEDSKEASDINWPAIFANYGVVGERNRMLVSLLEKHKEAGRTALLAQVERELPQSKPKVVNRRGYYPPFQPQVEQHRRMGYNEALNEFHQALNRLKDNTNPTPPGAA